MSTVTATSSILYENPQLEVQSGELKLHIGLTLPLSEAVEAHRQLEGRETVGKILLTPG